MAVTGTKVASELIIRVETGVNAQGAATYARRRFSNIKPNANHEDIFAVGQSLASLQSYTVDGLQRIDTYELEEA